MDYHNGARGIVEEISANPIRRLNGTTLGQPHS